MKKLGVDYLTVVGHKVGMPCEFAMGSVVQFYGPRVGALYCRDLGEQAGIPLTAMFHGGGQVAYTKSARGSS